MTSTNDVGNSDLISLQDVNPVIYVLLTQHYCTYTELRDTLNIHEVIQLYEICMTNLYNRSKMMEESSKK